MLLHRVDNLLEELGQIRLKSRTRANYNRVVVVRLQHLEVLGDLVAEVGDRLLGAWETIAYVNESEDPGVDKVVVPGRFKRG